MTTIDWLTKQPISHRGLHDLNNKRWENTLPAFQAAIDAGFAIECDVHLTKDKQVIIFHDNDLKRLANRDGSISDLTLEEARQLKIGNTNDCAPSLQDMLELVRGRVPIVIELKGIEGSDDGLVEAVAQQLTAYQGPVAIMSFCHHLIRQFSQYAPNIPCGLTAEGSNTKALEAHFSMLAHDLDFVSFHVTELPCPFITFVRNKLNLPVITWTVKDMDTKRHSDQYADQITFEGFDPRAMIA